MNSQRPVNSHTHLCNGTEIGVLQQWHVHIRSQFTLSILVVNIYTTAWIWIQNLETHEAAWCNNDNNYSEALSGAIAFKFASLYKLINAAYDYKEDASTLIELARTGEHKMLSILASVGEDFRATTNFRDEVRHKVCPLSFSRSRSLACAHARARVLSLVWNSYRKREK